MRRLDGKYLLVGTGVGILFDIILQLFYNLVRHNELLPYDSPGACLSDLLYNMVPCLLILLSNYLVIFTLWSRFRRKPALWLKMTVDAVLSFLLLFIINRLFLVVARIFQPETTVDVPGTILYNIVIFMCVEVAYHVAAAYELRHRQDVARQELLAYKYNLLNAQVNPHFLFNSLNNLLYLIRSNPDGACEFTRNLSRLYRHVLEVRDKSTVPLSEELDFMWHYVSILSIRYNNALNVDFQGAGACRRASDSAARAADAHREHRQAQRNIAPEADDRFRQGRSGANRRLESDTPPKQRRFEFVRTRLHPRMLQAPGRYDDLRRRRSVFPGRTLIP